MYCSPNLVITSLIASPQIRGRNSVSANLQTNMICSRRAMRAVHRPLYYRMDRRREVWVARTISKSRRAEYIMRRRILLHLRSHMRICFNLKRQSNRRSFPYSFDTYHLYVPSPTYTYTIPNCISITLPLHIRTHNYKPNSYQLTKPSLQLHFTPSNLKIGMGFGIPRRAYCGSRQQK